MSILVLCYLILGGGLQSPLQVGDGVRRAALVDENRERELFLQQMLLQLDEEFDRLSLQTETETIPADVLSMAGAWATGPWVWTLAGALILGLFVLRRRRPRPKEKEKKEEVKKEEEKVKEKVEEEEEGRAERDVKKKSKKRVAFREEEHRKERTPWPCVQSLQAFYKAEVSQAGRDGAVWGAGSVVRGLVDSLLRTAKGFGQAGVDVLREECVGVGSLFEGWGVRGGKLEPVYDVLVAISAPAGLSFRVELGYGEGFWPGSWLALPEHLGQGRVRVMGASRPPPPPGSDVRRLAAERKDSLDCLLEEGLRSGEHLDPTGMLQWLGAALRKGWTQQANFNLLFGEAACPCRLRLEYGSGQALWVNVLPAVRLEGSDVYLVTQGPVFRPPLHWVQWFAVYEARFLQEMTQRLPPDSCHMRCLQILAYIHASCTGGCAPPLPNSSRGPVSSFLSSFHIKTAFLHVLFSQGDPESWAGGQLSDRVREVLYMLQHSLDKQRLFHFVVGNQALCLHLGLPSIFRNAPPLNLFRALQDDHALRNLALTEFRRLLERLGDIGLSARPREPPAPRAQGAGTEAAAPAPADVTPEAASPVPDGSTARSNL
ncbi:inositol 1,4,5-trisphosphate receptor-interacting protein-like [Lepisosteus oculatus]|uniref:inositol 1,4,5-trisphosphate receptor-interacting protein-like n=1 Tax=Lepisosteus oculatus TaxID=7918 RepID=UPI0035F52EDF